MKKHFVNFHNAESNEITNKDNNAVAPQAASAIRYVEHGFPASAEIFLPGGAPPSTGQMIVRSDYACTWRAIAHGGSDILYAGKIGEMVVQDMAANGGITGSP